MTVAVVVAAAVLEVVVVTIVVDLDTWLEIALVRDVAAVVVQVEVVGLVITVDCQGTWQGTVHARMAVVTDLGDPVVTGLGDLVAAEASATTVEKLAILQENAPAQL